jgi:hypothetical protein
MSNYRAIATVTAALVQLLNPAVSADVPGAQVTWLRPNGTGNGVPATGVNLYLYQVTPNVALRNADLPARDSQGRLVQRPCAALDLHYLMTFYGDDTRFEPQLLLGSVVRTLHEQPILTRDLIANTLDANPGLADSDLAEAVELVKFTPAALALEELSKLWSVFFQTPYTLSVAYQGTVICIESEQLPRTALPVRERQLYGTPFAQPVIDAVQAADGKDSPLLAGSTLVVKGRHLWGDDTLLRLGEVEAPVTPAQMSDRQIRLPLTAPPFPDALRAGVQGVQVIHRLLLGTPPTPHIGPESDAFAVVLHPTISSVQFVTLQPTPAEPLQPAVRMDIAPKVGRKQRTMLLLNQIGDPARAYTVPIPEPDPVGDSLTIPLENVEPGTYLVRIQVDGAASLLEVAGDPQNPVYTGPKVTIP